MRRDVFADEAVSLNERESARPSPKHGQGAVCVQWVRCGRAWCRCMQGGLRHGPYYARYWWQDGRRYKRYVHQAEAVELAAECTARRVGERQERARAESARRQWRGIRALIREVERGER